MNKVRFGLVGYGLFGAHHARSIANSSSAELVAIAAKSSGSQQAARDQYPNVSIYGDYRELLARHDIDLVDVVVPNYLHAEITLAALRSGKHVLLEKPMATSIGECNQIMSALASSGKLLAVNHELRLSTLWKSVKDLIDQGVIGHPQHALVELSRFPYRHGSDGWRWDIQRVGNWILEEPIHFFDLARWYLSACGNPISIYARANSRHAERPELRDNFSAIVNFQDGGYAVVSQTLAAFEHHVSAKVTGTLGTIWAKWSAPDARSDQPTFSLRYGLASAIHTVDNLQPAGELVELAEQIETVARCIHACTSPPCNAADGYWSAALCLAAQRSVELGTIVNLEGFTRAD